MSGLDALKQQLKQQKEKTEEEVLREIYLPDNPLLRQSVRQLSKNAYYIGGWSGFGALYARKHLWQWKQAHNCTKGSFAYTGGTGLFRSQEQQEKALDETIAGLKNCVLISTTPTYFAQYQNACLLHSRGFKLVGGKCYKNPSYPRLGDRGGMHPGAADNYMHWEHIWLKVLGEPKELGAPLSNATLTFTNCGIDGANGIDEINARQGSFRRNYLCIGWLKRGTLFPKGWKRFYSAADYKLGVNFDAVAALGSTVQDCAHNFDAKQFEKWQPDFSKWTG